jgi:hypothetical protein
MVRDHEAVNKQALDLVKKLNGREDVLPLSRYFLATIIPDDPHEIDDEVCRFLVNRRSLSDREYPRPA